MKRTAMQHTKLKKRPRLLGIPQYAAVGILESLWHLCAREAPMGNIGKLTNEDIAIWIDWDRGAEELMSALVSCGWVDASEEFRLVIHDWEEHRMDPTRRCYPQGKRQRRWQRLRAAGGEISPRVRAFILNPDGRCRHCLTVKDLTVDHIIPVSKGGTNAIANLQALCRPCNSRKRDSLEVRVGA